MPHLTILGCHSEIVHSKITLFELPEPIGVNKSAQQLQCKAEKQSVLVSGFSEESEVRLSQSKFSI